MEQGTKLGFWWNWSIMEAVMNPQPLQARPFITVEDDDGDYEDAMDELEEANNVNSVTIANHAGVIMTTSRTSELTLSFEGEVYVFPAVTPEKVILFYLLLAFTSFIIL